MSGIVKSFANVLRGSGGMGGGKGYKDAANTHRSNAHARLLLLLGEGPIKGLVDNGRSIIFDETRYQAENGELNFKGVDWAFRPGTPDQSVMPGMRGVETEFFVGQEARAGVPVVRSLNDPDFNAVRVTLRFPALFRQTDEGMKQHSVQFRIEVRHFNGAWQAPFGDLTIRGKWTSQYDKSYLFKLPTTTAHESHPWDIRLTRLSADEEDEKKQNDVYMGMITGIIEEELSYPDSALLGIMLDAQEFESGMPRFGVELDGKLIKIPSNYNPITRTYSGIWDGSFKVDYTDNPAWIYYDLIENDRYGLGGLLEEAYIDKWTLYDIGRNCDVMVPDGYGGVEPRFKIGVAITESVEAYELLQLIASAFRGMSFWSSGAVTATQDVPSDPVVLVNRANVINGEFIYSGSARTARHTVVHVRYSDPNDLYRDAIEVVRDPLGIVRYGERVKEIVAFGCTSRAQAHRLGLWVLTSELNETQTVTYRAGLDHSFVRPGEIVSVMDKEVSAVDQDGRLKRVVTLSEVELDREVEFEAGVGYKLHVTLPDGSVAERDIVNPGNGLFATVTLSAPLPSAPIPGAVFIVSSAMAAPKPWRVVATNEIEPHIYEVTALEHYLPKYAIIEGDPVFDPPSYRDESAIGKPTNLYAQENRYYENGMPYSDIVVSWTASPSLLAPRHYVQVTTPIGEVLTYPSVPGSTFEIDRIIPGQYTISVASLGLRNKRSDFETLVFVAEGWNGAPPPVVSGLKLREPFSGPNALLEWTFAMGDAPTNNLQLSHFTVQVWDNETNTLKREARTSLPLYDYTIGMNKADGGASRHLRFVVTATDIYARTSNPVTLIAQNDPIAAPTLNVTAGQLEIIIGWNDPQETDYVRTRVWVREDGVFDPVEVFSGKGGFYIHKVGEAKTYYVSAAHVDTFSDDDFIMSSEVAVSPYNLTLDIEPPAVPTGLVLTSEAIPGETGSVKLVANWNANTETDFAYYDLQIREGAGNWTSHPGSVTTRDFRVPAGKTFHARLLAVDALGNKSAFTLTESHITLKDTVAPAVPSTLVTRASFRSIWLEWAKNAEPDLAGYEIAMLETDVTPSVGYTGYYTSTGNSFTLSGLGTGQTWYFWVRAKDTSGNRSAWSAVASATTVDVGALDLNLVAPVALDTLPVPPFDETTPIKVFNRADNKFYVLHEGEYVEENDAKLLTGNLSGSLLEALSVGEEQIKNLSISATKITPRAVRTPLLATNAVKSRTIRAEAITADKIAAGSIEAFHIKAESIIAESLASNVITARHLAAENVVTEAAQIADAIIDTAHINELDAVIIKSGFLSADRIETGSLAADKIRLSGASTLASWQMGGDETNIDGGMISANTILANSAVFGLRGVTVEGVEFEHNKPGVNQVSWSDGTLKFTGDDGNIATVNIAAGSAAWTTGVLYLTFRPGDGAIDNTTVVATAFQPDRIVMAAYRGGTDLVANYGRTIIDGSKIKTGTVEAEQIASLTIETRHLTAQSIEGQHLKIGTITADRIAADTITADKLSVTAKNMINDPGTTRSKEGWDMQHAWDIVNITANGPIHWGMQVVSAADRLIHTDYIAIQPNVSYELWATLYDSRTAAGNPGGSYWGFYAYDIDFNPVSVEAFTAAGVSEGMSSNPYFWNGKCDGWRTMRSYLVGWNTSAQAIPSRENVARYFKLPPNVRYIKQRILNYYNAGNEHIMYAGGFSMRPVGSGKITATMIETESLSAITADMGTITAGILRSADGKFVINLNAKTISIEV